LRETKATSASGICAGRPLFPPWDSRVEFSVGDSLASPTPRQSHGRRHSHDRIVIDVARRGTRRIACRRAGVEHVAVREQTDYQVTTLVADESGKATNTDGNLQNAFGLIAGTTSTFWISANHTGFSTLYNGLGAQITPPSPVIVPPTKGAGPGSPTGITTNPSRTDFLVDGTAAIFIWATEDGGIAAWKGGPTAFIQF